MSMIYTTSCSQFLHLAQCNVLTQHISLCDRDLEWGDDLLPKSTRWNAARVLINLQTACERHQKHQATDLLGYIPANGFKPLIQRGETWSKHVKAAVSVFRWQIRETLQAVMALHTLFRCITQHGSRTLLCLLLSAHRSCQAEHLALIPLSFFLKQVTLLVYTHTKTLTVSASSKLFWFDSTQRDFELIEKTFHHLMHTCANYIST